MSENNKIDKKEWRFVLLFSIAVAAISVLPYLYGYFISPPDKQFMGVHSVNATDTSWYISLIEQAREGKILFSYLSFPEYQQPIIFHPLFLLMGWFAKIFNMPNFFVYHLFRAAISLVFLWIGYIFISHFLKEVPKRKIALFFLALGSGIGWIFLAATSNLLLAPDTWVKEINGFLTLYETPLDTSGIILMLIIFLSFFKLLETLKTKYAAVVGLVTLLLLFIHPYEFVIIVLLLLSYTLFLTVRQKISLNLLWNKILLIFVLSLPGIMYNFYAVTYSPALNFWLKSEKGEVPSLHPIGYLIGFGLLGLFSLAAIYKIIKQRNSNFYFLLFWIAAGVFLTYQPWIYFQKRFFEGIGIVFAILAAEGIFIFSRYLKKYFSKTTAEGLILWIVVFTTFSNLVIIQRDIVSYKTRSWPFYLEKDYLNAFEWIKNNAARNEIILSNRDLAFFIPGATGNPIFLGLLVREKSDYGKNKIAELKWFFEKPGNETEKYKFLKQNNIGFFLYAPDSFEKQNPYYSGEKNVYYYNAKNLNPEKINGLKLVYQNNKSKIYKVE